MIIYKISSFKTQLSNLCIEHLLFFFQIAIMISLNSLQQQKQNENIVVVVKQQFILLRGKK